MEKTRPYEDQKARSYYSASEENITPYCYIFRPKKDFIHLKCDDKYYDINLPCNRCNNPYRKLVPFKKSELYGPALTKCDLCPYRIPDDHVLYHCFFFFFFWMKFL